MDANPFLILGGACLIGSNIAAMILAGYGLWRGVTRDYETKRDQVEELQRQVDARDLEIARLREKLWQQSERGSVNVIQSGPGARMGQSAAGSGMEQT